ncbi:unnamed protein product [Pleuronectes platessa]|uniref:Ig-like domain-containing protein n=1 Tax=Pleuronectes platessa TaxID=8262 RepID=A0A9N7Z9P5_PLEPL|nr:unnamed protein product [Pleuronectes platessa]
MNVILCLGFVLGALSDAATVIHSKPRQSVTLKCGVVSYSGSLTWKHKDEMIIQIARSGPPRKGPAAIKLRSRLRDDKDLVISEVRKEDAGAFTCEADGQRYDHTLLVVSVSASPSEELQPGGEVRLNGRGRTDCPHAGPEFHLNPVAASDAGAWHCEFSHGGETYREELAVRVKEPVSSTSPPVQRPEDNKDTLCPGCGADPHGWGGPLGWWLWAAAGAGCVVVLLLTALVIVFCRRIRRRKRKLQQMMKKGQRSARPKTYSGQPRRNRSEDVRRGGRPPSL